MTSSLVALSAPEIMSWLGKLWWPFLRIGALLWMMPLLHDFVRATSVRVLLSMLLAILVAPLMPPMPVVDPFSLAALGIAFEQIAFGALLGLMGQMLFTVLTMLGQIISLQMGLAMAVMNDPVNGQSVPLQGQLLMILGGLLFLAVGGHLVMINIVVASFDSWPVGQSLFNLDLQRVISLLGWVFGAALILAMPVIVAMLIVNMGFGVMTRSAPSLNIFSLGFPLTMLTGLGCLLLTIFGVPERFIDFSSYALQQMQGLAGSTP